MEPRQERGLQIAATTKLRQVKGAWIVPAQTRGWGEYRVEQEPDWRIGGFICECADFAERAQPCKHIFAVEITMRRETETVTDDGTVTTCETQTMRVTYGQDWPAYNAAQCAEGDLFPALLRDLCDTVPQPPQGKGRPRLPRSDMIFTAVSRVYADKSARRYDAEVREAKSEGLTSCDPAFGTVLRYLRDPELTPILTNLVKISATPLASVEEDFAADSTGFTTCQHERWYDHKWGKERSRNKWVKLHAMTGVLTNVITSVVMTDGHAADTRFLEPILTETAESFTIRKVTADKAYSSKKNLQAVENAGGVPFVPYIGGWPSLPSDQAPDLAPETSVFYRMKHLFIYQRDLFLQAYHCRSNVESTFSALKRKFGGRLRSKTETGQMNEVLCKVIAYNLTVLIAAVHQMGLPVPEFSQPTLAG